jgi:uncharacterized damage-inducible protein DinB
MKSSKEQLLEAVAREHQTTLRVLRAFPTDQAELRPHPKSKTAKELAFIFVLERGLATRVMNGTLNMTGKPPDAPDSIEEIITALEQAQREYEELLRSYSDEQYNDDVTFLVAPRTPGPVKRIEFAWFMLFDEIHHRGQFSVYLRMANGRVPSIYGPTADEPWM